MLARPLFPLEEHYNEALISYQSTTNSIAHPACAGKPAVGADCLGPRGERVVSTKPRPQRDWGRGQPSRRRFAAPTKSLTRGSAIHW